ncbi:MAG: B12-binding domain-containing radical SAM protein [Thermodesulfobacteriota bacterium]
MYERALWVRLPCRKIYPAGMIYLANYLHEKVPAISQRMIELSSFDKSEQFSVLKDAIQGFRPEVIFFSWRDAQNFGSGNDGPTPEVVFGFYHPYSLSVFVSSIKNGLKILWNYRENIHNNLKIINKVSKKFPSIQIVVGGTGFSLFADRFIKKMPKGTIGVIGEGENPVLKIIRGEDILDEAVIVKEKNNGIIHGKKEKYFDIKELSTVDFQYIEGIFPQLKEYLFLPRGKFLHSDFIGVQTKRGCPYRCTFCLYNHENLEGKTVRYRPVVSVIKEIKALKGMGMEKVWFADAQWCPSKTGVLKAEELLDEMISANLNIRWTTYLRIDNYWTDNFIKKLIKSGIYSIDLSFHGSQKIVDILRLEYDVEEQIAILRKIKEYGGNDQKIRLYIPFNAPGETKETLKKCIEKIEELYTIFGRERVEPFVFFLGIQPDTELERQLIKEGYLKEGYNPLTMNPFTINKLLYNPPPLGPMIAKAYLDAARRVDDPVEMGRVCINNMKKAIT